MCYFQIVKLVGALYLIFVFVTTVIGAFLASEAFCAAFGVSGATRHPIFASVLHIGLFGVLFIQGLVIHFRLPAASILSIGFLGISGVFLAALHFLK